MKSLILLILAGVAGAVSSPPKTPVRLLVAAVDTVDVTPAQDTVFRRGSTLLTARVVDSVGRRKNANVAWVARDTSLIRLRSSKKDSTGFYSVTVWSRADTGRTYVVATSGAKKDSALVVSRDTTCSTTILASINLVPDSATAHRTDTLGFGMHPKNQCGGAMNGINPTFSGSGAVTVSRVDSLWMRAIATDSTGTGYAKAVSGTVRDSVKIKLKPAP